VVFVMFKNFKVIELYTWQWLGVRRLVEDEDLGGYMHSLPAYESLAIVLRHWKKDANLPMW
jgi:hypothetical protein